MVDEKIFQLCESVAENDTEIIKNLEVSGWKANLKFDGSRLLGIRTKDGVFLMNRRGIEKSLNFKEVADDLMFLPVDTIVDGEVISLDDNFSILSKRDHTTKIDKVDKLREEIPVKYMIFDILQDQGTSIMNLPLNLRLDRLKAIFRGMNGKTGNLELA
ncbi:hypothetical protein M0R04_08675, partial [Candidatus Dojkabacteria bacterium]|nr:hypothetical protein [Candidatus Dojkabacteria bacterium]